VISPSTNGDHVVHGTTCLFETIHNSFAMDQGLCSLWKHRLSTTSNGFVQPVIKPDCQSNVQFRIIERVRAGETGRLLLAYARLSSSGPVIVTTSTSLLFLSQATDYFKITF
jgi:hypothetical protein